MRNPRRDTNGLKKGTWTPEEDRKLIAYVTRYGCWNWRQLPRFAGLARCGKSCRLRWLNYLRPDIKRGHYSKEEDELIIKLHHQLGNRWSTIAAKLPGRTDNEIKNHWHTNLKNRHKTQPPDNDDIIFKEGRQGHSQGVTDSAASRVEAPDNGKSRSESTSSESSYVTPSESNNEDLVGEHEFSFLDAYREPIMGGNLWTDPFDVDSDLFFYPTSTEPTPRETEAQVFGPLSGVSQLWTHNFYDQYCGHFYNSSQ